MDVVVKYADGVEASKAIRQDSAFYTWPGTTNVATVEYNGRTLLVDCVGEMHLTIPDVIDGELVDGTVVRYTDTLEEVGITNDHELYTFLKQVSTNAGYEVWRMNSWFELFQIDENGEFLETNAVYHSIDEAIENAVAGITDEDWWQAQQYATMVLHGEGVKNMGLSQYLYATKYVSESDFERYKIISGSLDTENFAYQDYKAVTVGVKVAQWRRAYQIQQWFVDNVQDGEDDCREHYVERVQLQELFFLCKRLLESKDEQLAEELLPNMIGFDSLEIDENYWEQIADTVRQLDRILVSAQVPDDWEFSYDSSYQVSSYSAFNPPSWFFQESG